MRCRVCATLNVVVRQDDEKWAPTQTYKPNKTCLTCGVMTYHDSGQLDNYPRHLAQRVEQRLKLHRSMYAAFGQHR